MLNNPVDMRTIWPCLLAGMLTATAVNTDAAPVIYTNEAAFIDALTTAGYGTLHEDFEDDVVWAASRSSISDPASTPQVNSQGILWSSNFATNDIVTSDSGIAGSFGFYSSPHGDPDVETNPAVCDVEDPIPEQCFLHDGFIGNSAATLYGVGGWIKGTFGADVTLFLDGIEVDFGDGGIISSWTFLGVINEAGFNSFEFREIDGKSLQGIFIFADNVTMGVSAVPDLDADGVADQVDNCTVVQNPDQQDTDSDGYGNMCDGDLNNDGSTNTLDLNLYKLAHRTNVGDASYNVDADFNGDDMINTLDLNIYKGLHRKPPGPSCCGLF